MTKAEFVELLAKDHRLGSKKDASELPRVRARRDHAGAGRRRSQLHRLRQVPRRRARPRQGVNPRTGERITIPGGKVPRFSAGSALKSKVKGGLSAPFADRLAALVEERRSQVCLGLDPDPASLLPGSPRRRGRRRRAAGRTRRRGGGRPLHRADRAGRTGLRRGQAAARLLRAPRGAGLGGAGRDDRGRPRGAGLLVIADGKRGDVPVTAAAYAQALVGETPTPWGPVAGLGADAFTANPLLGGDALEPLIAAAEAAGRRGLRAGPDLEPRRRRPPGRRGPAAARAAGGAGRRARRPPCGVRGLSGMGAVVGATEPELLGRLRELMPSSIFLIPGVGAQGGKPEDARPGAGRRPARLRSSSPRRAASPAPRTPPPRPPSSATRFGNWHPASPLLPTSCGRKCPIRGNRRRRAWSPSAG